MTSTETGQFLEREYQHCSVVYNIFSQCKNYLPGQDNIFYLKQTPFRSLEILHCCILGKGLWLFFFRPMY